MNLNLEPQLYSVDEIADKCNIKNEIIMCKWLQTRMKMKKILGCWTDPPNTKNGDTLIHKLWIEKYYPSFFE
jgi:hypothetical protein